MFAMKQPVSLDGWLQDVAEQLKQHNTPLTDVLWQRLLTASARLHYESGDVHWQTQGPSSSQTPYIVPLDPHVSLHAILTTGDAVGEKLDPPSHAGEPHRMPGIPDGIGAYDNGNGTFTVLLNHEIPSDEGIERQHGAKGAFVEELVIDKDTLKVLDADDLIQRVYAYDTTDGQYHLSTTAFGRFCSANLADKSAFFNAADGKGFDGLIFMNGEEASPSATSQEGGRAMAHIATGALAGTSYELPSLGNAAWENLVANNHTGDKTVVIGMDDTSPGGQVYVYVGDKQATGTPVQQAGLEGGNLYGIQVDAQNGDPANEDRQTGFGAQSAHFDLASVGDMTDKNGWDLEQASDANHVTKFLRPEDGAWDTVNANRFYFVTTDKFNSDKLDGSDNNDGVDDGRTRLWRLTFDDVTHPEKGGKIEMMLDGTGPYQMLDNITVNSKGQVLMQEDPGNQAYTAKIWQFDPNTEQLTLLAQHDPARFGSLTTDPTPPFTHDEESSGILDVSKIIGQPGKDVYLLDVQAHYDIGDPELVEGGQLLAMQVDHNATHTAQHHEYTLTQDHWA